MAEGTEAVKEAKAFLERKCKLCGRSKADLVITDVPKETKKLFLDFANSDEFTCGQNKGGHYGFALKFLLDFYLGRVPNGYDELDDRISDMESEVGQKVEDKAIKLCSGKELKLGG